jgi:hypothetical protein
MAVGLPTNKLDIDSKAGSIAVRLRDVFQEIQYTQAWLAGQPDADLVALGYTQAEVNTLKSALSDLDQLRTIFTGNATLATAKDFRTFAKRLCGLG